MEASARTRSTRVQRWEGRTDWPLAGAAVVFLVSYAIPVLDPSLGAGGRRVCSVVDAATWLLFIVDVVIRFTIADPRLPYAVRHIPDVLMVALPVLRPLRLLRLVTLIRFLDRSGSRSLRGRVVVYVIASGTLVVLCAGLAALDAERGHPGATITTFGDALWWAISTISTVGYGDVYPVTGTGRMIGVGLMFTGIALLGIVTAAIAAFLLDRIRGVEAEGRAATSRDIGELRDEIRRLHDQLAADHAVDRGTPATVISSSIG